MIYLKHIKTIMFSIQFLVYNIFVHSIISSITLPTRISIIEDPFQLTQLLDQIKVVNSYTTFSLN